MEEKNWMRLWITFCSPYLAAGPTRPWFSMRSCSRGSIKICCKVPISAHKVQFLFTTLFVQDRREARIHEAVHLVIIQVLTAFFHKETKFPHLKSLAKGRIPALMSSSLIKEGLFEAPPERRCVHFVSFVVCAENIRYWILSSCKERAGHCIANSVPALSQERIPITVLTFNSWVSREDIGRNGFIKSKHLSIMINCSFITNTHAH